ncbi:aflH/ adhA/ short chain alcohol dehydrogenase [Periconia macrospinosa]|uniref:AflH/ adhA/ short chain alcohol dehydrogenase n=1 Tax=Periconia macrospinosa TaxID=97972 RepID=A0A2V1DIP6_9PLEO|nr:aflH/ adhA/ short chain alcohol dehydrogenase [Periconia macrospinosa]
MAILPLAPTDASNVKGLSVLITGGASGLGLHAATFFAKSGALVTIADVQDGSKIAADLVSQGYTAQFVECDVTNWDSQVNAFRTALNMSPTKTLDMVAAFAGVDGTGHLVDHVSASEVSLDGAPPPVPSLAPIEVNLKGAFYTTTLALHYFRLKPQGGGGGAPPTTGTATKSLNIVTSLAGYIDDTHSTPYTASKFGSRGLFRAVHAQAHQQLNVRVNAICPWAMKTPMIEKALDRMAEFGILPSKGITLVDHDVLTQALARITVDESISGRAFGIVPEGAIDLGDDIEGSYGGSQLVELMALRKQAGDFLHS